MSDPIYNFQYCPKLIIFSEDWKSLLLAKRTGEADYDGTFSFIGGKMETSDMALLDGIRREKSEEIGESAKVRVYMDSAHILLFRKKDGNAMVLPHYVAQYTGGVINLLASEYAEYRWVPVTEIAAFQPKIETITPCVDWALALLPTVQPAAFVLL